LHDGPGNPKRGTTKNAEQVAGQSQLQHGNARQQAAGAING